MDSAQFGAGSHAFQMQEKKHGLASLSHLVVKPQSQGIGLLLQSSSLPGINPVVKHMQVARR
jgi:hypothetical protein